MRRALALVPVAAALGLTAGCGEPPLQQVTGTVTYDGRPLPAGVVWFDPEGDHGTKAPQGFAFVEAGRFDTADKGRGVRPGPYTVRVDGFDGVPGPELPRGKTLFPSYREVRDLADGPVALDLNIPKAK